MPQPPNTAGGVLNFQHWQDPPFSKKFHRTDGPAVINADNRSWVVEGRYIMTVFNGGPFSSGECVYHHRENDER